jgi:uncharacterized membrane protein
MSYRVIGLFIGLALGIVWVALGFGAAVLTGILALIGWFLGGVAEGRINVVEVWNDLQGRRRSLF